MSNEPSFKCPQCGAPIKEDAPAGLCPACLMALNLKTETVFTGDTPAAQPPLPPDQIAPHFPQLEIIECLGRGGMGVVYKARQKSLNRFVALKLLAPERVTDPRFAERFTREAHALAALNHPHIVTIYDFGQAGGYYFLLMEFVDGVNLSQLLQAGKLKPEEALAIVPPLCDALQYAHEHGIVHRDIKPANLLLDKAGRVKIADFGIAKMVGDHSSGGFAESQPAGTPQYMAPEQKDHQRTDHRADIYSLGVVLYEMLTGELPVDKFQPPSRKVQIDVRLDQIVLRALEKTPELRYQTAGDMRTQIETVLSTPGSSGSEAAHTASPPRFLKVCASTLTTPAEISTFRGQFFLYRTRGQLILDDRQLTHSRAGINTVIPLAAIRDLSIGRYPRSTNPAGIDLLSVTYEEAGKRKQVLLSPVEGWFGLPSTWNARIAEWFAAIREAVVAATGRAPAITPASELGVPRGSFSPLLALAGVPVLLGMVLVWVLTTSQRGPSSHVGGMFQFVAIAFAIGFVSFLILGRLMANWSRPAAPGSISRRVLGVVLILMGLGVGWIQMRDGKRTYAMNLALMTAEIPSLQSQWSAAKTEESVTRNALSWFESHTANPRTDAERKDNEIERQRLLGQVTQVVERGDALNKTVMDYTERINQLRFPDPGTLKRILLLTLPFILGGLALMFWRSGPVAERRKPFFATYAGWLTLLIPVLLLGFLLMPFAGRRAVQPSATLLEWLPVGVSNNIVIVDVTVEVERGNVQLHAELVGPNLPSVPDSNPGEGITLVKPTPHVGNQTSRLLSPGRQISRLGFVLPNSAIAEQVFQNLHSTSLRPVLRGQILESTIFEVSQPDGEEYRATFRVSAPLTPADPNWVSIAGRVTNDDSTLRLNWEVTASRAGTARLTRDANRASTQLQADSRTGDYHTSIRLDVARIDTNRVLIVRQMGGTTSREEFIGKFGDLVEELVRTATLTATTARGASTELCRIQGKSLSVLVGQPTVPVPTAHSGGISITSVAIVVIFLLISIVGAVLFVFIRKNSSARKVVMMLVGVTLLLFVFILAPGSLAATPLVNHSDTWRYHKGTNAPQADWQTITDASLDATWATGTGGFGYGDPGIVGEATTLGDMQNLYTTFNIRRSFTVNSVIDTNLHFQLTIDYDDGFVAYLDGAELTRANAPGASGTEIANTALASGLHEASCCNAPVNPVSVIDLGPVGNRLGLGTHVLAFIGLNASAASTDAHLIADLALTTNTSPPPGSLSLVLTTNVAPSGYLEVDGVDAGAFDPVLWQAGRLNLLPDYRSPFLSPLNGTWRNIYAPSAVETPAGYRLFYGGWDGVATGNDRIYSLDADFQFQNFANRHWVIVPGTYIHVNNVNALRFDDGSFAMNATLYPVTNLNKPVFLKSDTTGTNWSGGVGEPYTINASNVVNITGYNYAPADINGMNVMLHEDGVYRLYFGDFQNFNGVFRATSTDGKNYAYESKALNGVYAVNDVKKFLVGGTNYYLMGLHRNTDRLWYSLSTNALGFTSVPTLLTNAAAADLYIVAMGWVVRGPQESPGRKLLGVLYGAGAVSTLDKNFIFARWLQKRVAFVSTDGTRSEGTQSLGPQRQLIAFSQGNPVAGHFEVYAEDGITLLGTSPAVLLQSGQTYQLQFSPSPIPIGIQRSGNNKVILNWTNPVFRLQSSLVVTGAFAAISNSASPYTNAVTGAAQYFRLQVP